MGSSALPIPLEPEDLGTSGATAFAKVVRIDGAPLAFAEFDESSHGLEQDEQSSEPYRVGDWLIPAIPCVIRGIRKEQEILAIRYPRGSKRRYFTYEAGMLVRVETVLGEDGSTRILYQRDKESRCWSMMVDGINVYLPGEICLSDNGVLHIQVDNAGRCRKEFPDGTTSIDMDCQMHLNARREAKTDSSRQIDLANAFAGYSNRSILDLLSAVSHDLRSPLTSIQGLLTLLSAGAFGDIPDKARERIANVETDLTRLTRLINELLDAEMLVSGKLVMHKQLIDVQDLFDAAIGSLSGMAMQQSVHLTIVKSNLQLLADRDRLIRVIVNIVANAIKYSPKGGTVVLSAECDNEHVVLCIRDNGRGIPAMYKQSIFERYQQVIDSDWSEKGGSGLGLAISRSIVEAHGGEIGVESQIGAGSLFWVRLPANAGSAS